MRSHSFTGEQLEKIAKFIVAEFREMNEAYEIERFIPNPNPRDCLRCHFASVCPHSMASEHLNE